MSGSQSFGVISLTVILILYAYAVSGAFFEHKHVPIQFILIIVPSYSRNRFRNYIRSYEWGSFLFIVS